jgi:hypothetical protein
MKKKVSSHLGGSESRVPSVDITFLLDRSGSMGSVASATIEGFNKFPLDRQRGDGEARMGLVQLTTKSTRSTAPSPFARSCRSTPPRIGPMSDIETSKTK